MKHSREQKRAKILPNSLRNKPGKTKWLVTVAGYDFYCNPPHETVTTTIYLKQGRTPIDWFLNKPTVCHYRFDFVPHALINFWKI